jgi:UDP-N-acetylmuramoyl-L-alanyl-D-glutamate--2,6-diaminopimelate ligase
VLLSELINSVKAIQVTGAPFSGEVTGIEYDSRKIVKGSVFVAIKGFKTDGHAFIQDALNKKASAVVLEDNNAVPEQLITHSGTVKILVEDSRKALAELSNVFYDEPSKKLKLVGITGTNGKTTTAFFIKHIYETAGFKVGLIGTIQNFIGDQKIESKLTTPESSDLNKMFSEMIKAGCEYAVMEVSSHSLALKRVHSIHFALGVFTNITPEHLDFHKDFENYLSAKKILFDSLSPESFALYNSDDVHSVDVMNDCASKKFSFGTSAESDFRLEAVNCDLSGTTFNIYFRDKSFRVKTSLVGDFNALNAAAAFAVTKLSGIEEEIIIRGIETTPQVPGRFEVLNNGTRKVIIDYSHTPDSLEKALMVIRKITPKQSPVLTVFGCGGNRDKQKRPVMGKIATELSDRVIVTSDNPRNENPEAIIEEIKSGIIKNNYTVIENREQAIEKAIKEGGKNAVILIAGKGHEDYQEVNGVRKYFSDRETAKKYLNT